MVLKPVALLADSSPRPANEKRQHEGLFPCLAQRSGEQEMLAMLPRAAWRRLSRGG